MEIEVGEYIRTQTGYIGKLNKISTYKINNKDKTMYLVKFGNTTYAISLYDIAKHSKDITDLIEVGDYVNGQEVVTVYGYDEDGNDKDELGIIEIDNDFAYGVYLTDLNIKTILAHEQYEQNCYRLEEK